MADPVSHEAAMVAKVDEVAAKVAEAKPTAIGQLPAEAQKAPRPESVPEKFWDADKGVVNTDALLKSYTELEASRATPAAPEQKAAADAAKSAALDMSALEAEYAKDGKLSDASLEALAKAGISKETVDRYTQGQAAVLDKQTNAAMNLVGGKAQYAAMVQWAGTNLPKAEQEAFDSAVSGTPAQVKQAILSLKAQFDTAVGSDPKLLSGQSAAPGNADTPFASRAEVTAAMRDPRYSKDAAYRQMVERRIGLMDSF
jgi:hypothetical protein